MIFQYMLDVPRIAYQDSWGHRRDEQFYGLNAHYSLALGEPIQHHVLWFEEPQAIASQSNRTWRRPDMLV